MWPVPPYRSFSGRRPDVAASRGPSDYSCSVAGEFLDAACVGDGAPPSTPTQAPLRGKERQRVLQMGKDAHVLIDMVRVPAHGPVEETMVDRRTGRVWTVEVSPFEVATTVVRAASARLRRSSNQSGKYDPARSFGIATSIVPALVSKSRCR